MSTFSLFLSHGRERSLSIVHSASGKERIILGKNVVVSRGCSGDPNEKLCIMERLSGTRLFRWIYNVIISMFPIISIVSIFLYYLCVCVIVQLLLNPEWLYVSVRFGG